MNPVGLIQHARRLIASPPGGPAPTDVDLRRAVSAAYYAVFHLLTAAGAQSIAQGNFSLQNQVARAFSHTAMRKVCDAYVRSPARPFAQPGLAHLNPATPNPHLSVVAEAFAILQEARHAADYDPAYGIVILDASLLVELADAALADFTAVQSVPDTQVFLTALLLSDKWTRRV